MKSFYFFSCLHECLFENPTIISLKVTDRQFGHLFLHFCAFTSFGLVINDIFEKKNVPDQRLVTSSIHWYASITEIYEILLCFHLLRCTSFWGLTC